MLITCALFIAFEAGVGFLFGQLFAGHFSISATLTGLAGLASAYGALLLQARPEQTPPWLRWAVLLSLVGVALDVTDYYLHLAIPGNYYPWMLVAPFIACLVWVGYTAHQRSRH